MVASTRFPLKTLLVSTGLSASLALIGCATNGFSTAPKSDSGTPTTPNQAVPETTNQTTMETPNAPQTTLYSDWTSDRVVGNQAQGDFKTASFADSIKPGLALPAEEKNPKLASSSGGLANAFAKNLPGASEVNYLPNTPVVIADATTPTDANKAISYFLTDSKSSSNFYAIRGDGSLVWELSLHDNGNFDGSSPTLGTTTGTNFLYAISDNGRLYAVNASTGIVTSFVDIPEEKFKNASPFVTSGANTDAANTSDSVFLASYEDGRVYRYDFNGTTFTQDFKVQPVVSGVSGRFSSSPIFFNNGVYVGSEEGRVYKLNKDTGATVNNLDLSKTVRADHCQIKAEMVIDATQDVGIVPCGSYLYKLKLNDTSTTVGMSLLSQSPLLEIRTPVTLNPTSVLGPNHNNRPQLATTTLRDPAPTEASMQLEQQFGFQTGDYIRVNSATAGVLFGEVDTISEDGTLTFKRSGLEPIASPSPSPLLIGGETVSISNWVVRPTPYPSPDATPTPTPTPTAVGADPVSQFQVGGLDGLQEGDFIRFPNLTGQPVVQICDSSNANCDSSTTSKYSGIQLTQLIGSDSEEDRAYQLTVPGTNVGTLITAELNSSRFVPFERIENVVVGTTNSTQNIEVAEIKDFAVGQSVRITHGNSSTNGRYEYGTISSVNTSTRRITLQSPLTDAPANGDIIEIIDANTRVFGRVTESLKYSSGNILSRPVLRGNGQQVYVQHGNTLFELDYNSDSNFRSSADYLVLQSGRLEQSNVNLTSLSRSRPLILANDKLVTVDSDPSNHTGIYLNRVLLPLSSTAESLNDIFPILTPNSLGQLPNRAETEPVRLGTSNFVMFGGGNGVAYKLHKDVAW